MDIQVYEDIYKGLVDYNKNCGEPYGNTIAKQPPFDPCYPITIITEIRNTPNQQFRTKRERIASLAYKIDIIAKDKGKILKMDIARKIMKHIDEYMTDTMRFTLMSVVPDNLVDDNTKYRITLVYTSNYYENRQLIL